MDHEGRGNKKEIAVKRIQQEILKDIEALLFFPDLQKVEK